MPNVLTIDASGIHILEELASEARSNGYLLVFSAVSRSVYRVMRKSGFVDTVGRRILQETFTPLEIAERHLAATQNDVTITRE